MISLCCKMTKFPFSYSYKILSYTTFSGLHWKPDWGLSRTRDSGHAGPCSAVTSCRCSGWFSHGERLLFRRQNFCFHLHLDGTTWHLLHSHSWRDSHPARGLWQRYPFCWFPDAHIRIPQQKPNVFASQTPGSVSALSCIMVERNSQQLNISTTAQHLLNCYLI